MTQNKDRALNLRDSLAGWLEKNHFPAEGCFEVLADPVASDRRDDAEPVHFRLFIDDISDLFYKRENDQTRDDFDAIVRQHRFWYDFRDAVTLEFMVDEMPSA